MASAEKSKEERRFAALPPQCITSIADTIGIHELHPDIPRLLAEDVTYRLRALLQDASLLMKHARRKQLTSEDLNKALKYQDVPPIHGHGAPECPTWRQVKDPVNKETDLHFVEDVDVNLANVACGNQVPNIIGSTTIRANWLVVEGHQKSFGHQTGTGKPSKLVGEDLLRYYENITSAVTGCDTELTKIALNDLKTNPNISPLVSYFVQFVSSNIRTVSQSTAQVKLLYILEALLGNKNLFLSPTPIVHIMCESAMYCLVEPSMNDSQHWTMRDHAATLLANICSKWDNNERTLKKQQLNRLQAALKDKTRLFSSHYGVIVAVASFGVQAIEDTILCNLSSYWQHVMSSLNDPSLVSEKYDALHVVGALMNACEIYLKHHLLYSTDRIKHQTDSILYQTAIKMETKGGSNFTQTNVKTMYETMLECFGDSLVARLPFTMSCDRKQPQAKVLVSLCDADSHRTGEEMLKEFLQVPVKPEPMKQDSGYTIDSTTSGRSSRSERSQSEDMLFGDLTVKATVSDPGKGIKLLIGKKSLGDEKPKSKRQRRGVSKTRITDVFDVPLMRKKAITFHILGRPKEVSARPVGRPAKKGKTASVVSRPKISVPISQYRIICAKLVPYGKRMTKTKTLRSNFNFDNFI